MASSKYPLEQLSVIKQKKLEEAEKLLRDKKQLLKIEESKLKELEKARDKVKEHKDAKLTQLRETLDAGTTSDKIQQMKDYLKVVQEELKKHEVKVKDQKKKVESAEQEVENARKNLVKKQQDVEKLVEHRKAWEKGYAKELERLESLEADELGSAKHILRKHKKR